MSDPVNHPSHYTSHPSGIEAIQITRHMPFDEGTAMKYLWRAGLKSLHPGEVSEREMAEAALQDLNKAAWYVSDAIKMAQERLDALDAAAERAKSEEVQMTQARAAREATARAEAERLYNELMRDEDSDSALE